MTPRSRKPLIITSEQRDLPETVETKDVSVKSDMYSSLSPKNDSDFVSSDDDMSRSTFLSERYDFLRVFEVKNYKYIFKYYIV